MSPRLPDRVAIPTCIACGALGREARCEGDCSEHKLSLVGAGDLDELQAAGRSARAEAALLEAVVQRLTGEPPTEVACLDAFNTLRDQARATLGRLGHWDRTRDWGAPDTALGWWCAECGNVDAPQPCLGVCIWHRLEWVNASLYYAEYERCADELRAAGTLATIVGRIAAVSPKRGRCAETWEALQSQARISAGSQPSPRRGR